MSGEQRDSAAPTAAANANVDGSAVDGATEARVAFEQGLQFLHEGRWSSAEDAFRRSLAIVPRESTRYDLAYVLFKRDRIRQSLAILDALLGRDNDDGDERYRDYARTLRPHVLARLAKLRLETNTENATLTIDGEAIAGTGRVREVPVDPGEHVAELSAPGQLLRHVTFSAAPGGTANRSIVLVSSVASPPARAEHVRPDAAPSQPSSIHSIGPWLTMGVGGALLVASAITGIAASRTDGDFVSKCPSLRNCDPSLNDTRDKALALGHASDALLISGAVFVSGGVAWKFLAPSAPPTSTSGTAVLFLRATGSF